MLGGVMLGQTAHPGIQSRHSTTSLQRRNILLPLVDINLVTPNGPRIQGRCERFMN